MMYLQYYWKYGINSSSELQLSKLVPKNAIFLSLMRHNAATSMDL